jgi:transposase
MVDSGQKLQVAVVHSNGRRGFDPLSKERLLAACLEPGASVSRLALENGVNVNLVWKWLREYRATKKEGVSDYAFPASVYPGSD